MPIASPYSRPVAGCPLYERRISTCGPFTRPAADSNPLPAAGSGLTVLRIWIPELVIGSIAVSSSSSKSSNYRSVHRKEFMLALDCTVRPTIAPSSTVNR